MASFFVGLDDKVIPIEPKGHAMRMQLPTGREVLFEHHQRIMTAAYALTDHKSQVQTLPAVIMDLARPSLVKLALFNIMLRFHELAVSRLFNATSTLSFSPKVYCWSYTRKIVVWLRCTKRRKCGGVTRLGMKCGSMSSPC